MIAATAALGLAAQLAIGEDTGRSRSSSDKSSSSSGQNLRTSKAKGANVTSTTTGEKLGEVEEIIIDPASGKVEFVIIGTGGVGGVGEKHRPVPWEAFSSRSEKGFTLNADKQKLESAPTMTQEQFTTETPAEVIAIYEFYAVPVPVASGGTGSTAGSQQGQSSSQSQSGQDRSSQSTQGSQTNQLQSPRQQQNSQPNNR